MKVSLLSYKYPELEGPKTGVFAKIAHHNLNWNERNFETNYHRSYTNQFKDFQPRLTQQMKEEGVFAANDSAFGTGDQSLRITTTLVGEKYKSKYFKFTYNFFEN